MKRLSFILVVILLQYRFAFNQSIWLSRGNESSFSFEYLRPTFVTQPFSSTTLTGSVYVVSGRIGLSEKSALILELPYSVGDISSNFGLSASHSSIGNMYIGGEFASQDRRFVTEVGLRVPMAQEDKFYAYYTGLNSDIDHWEAFIPNVASLSALVNFKPRLETGFYLRLLGGSSLWLRTKPGTIRDDSEFFLNYGSIVGYDSDLLSAGLGITGKMLLTETGDLERRNYYQLGFIIGTTLGNIRPELHLRLPLDKNLKQSIDRVLVLQATVSL